MNAYIYAAGRGLRLGPEHGQRPKILLEFAGRTLLEWHTRRLREVGIQTLSVIIGYQSESIQGVLPGLEADSGLRIRAIVNPDFTEGSVLSLAASLPALQAEQGPMFLMDGDVLYPAEMLRRLINSRHRTALLIDRAYSTADDDPVLVPIRAGRPVDFRKKWTGSADIVGESIGFFKLDPLDLPFLTAAVDRRRKGPGRNDSYDEVLREMAVAGLFGHEDVTGLPWTELDFPGDVDFALRHVLPLIEQAPAPAE
jgi:choline kinase